MFVNQFQESEQSVSTINTDYSGKENIFAIENSPQNREIGITVRNMVSKNILANLSTAHIRQFVSPFYRQTTAYEPSKNTTKVLELKFQINPKAKRKSNQTSRSSSATTSVDLKNKKKIAKVVNRLCLPTQNLILKTLKEVPNMFFM